MTAFAAVLVFIATAVPLAVLGDYVMDILRREPMDARNWPGGVDRSHSNWTGRTKRSTEWGGNWAPNSYRIPPNVWIRVAAVIGLLFIVLPAIGAATGF